MLIKISACNFIEKKTPTKVFSYEFFEIFKSIFFTNISSPLLLNFFTAFAWLLLDFAENLLSNIGKEKDSYVSLSWPNCKRSCEKKQKTFRLGSGKWAHDLNWASMRNSYDVVDVLWTIFEVQVVKLGCQVFRLSDQSKISWKNLIHLCFSYLL